MGNSNGNCYNKPLHELQIEAKENHIPLKMLNCKEIEEEFEDSNADGTTTIITDEGHKVSGILRDKMIEEGVIKYADGSVYKGAIWQNKAHGKGYIRYDNGNIYKGRFANDFKHGEGTFQYTNGNIYKGTFHNNLFDGKGLFKFFDGSVYNGEAFDCFLILRWALNKRVLQRWGQKWLWGILF